MFVRGECFAPIASTVSESLAEIAIVAQNTVRAPMADGLKPHVSQGGCEALSPNGKI